MSLLLCVGYASLYHLWGGRSLWELGLFFVLALIGFAAGQALGVLLSMDLVRVGQLHVLEASIGAWLALFSARWFGTSTAPPR